MRHLSLLFASITASVAFACGKVTEVEETNDAGAQTDASTQQDSGTQQDASAADASRDGSADAAPDASCATPQQVLREDACTVVYSLPCGLPEGVDPSDGMSTEECSQVCPPLDGSSFFSCGEYNSDDLPGPAVGCFSCIEGRRPAGYESLERGHGIGDWLAHAAELEQVSIDAFEILRRELEAHGAPRELRRRALQAARDEIHHARMLSALARREHATLRDVQVQHGPVRGLLEIAIENAVEGCVRETYGALVAAWQAKHARRPEIRRSMDRIQRDETAHAELAWDVHAWALGRLDQDERAHVEAAMQRAVAELEAGAALELAPALIRELGLPTRDAALRIVAELDAQLWGAPSRAA